MVSDAIGGSSRYCGSRQQAGKQSKKGVMVHAPEMKEGITLYLYTIHSGGCLLIEDFEVVCRAGTCSREARERAMDEL